MFGVTLSGHDLVPSRIRLPRVVSDDVSVMALESCRLLDIMFGLLDELLAQFVRESGALGAIAYDHLAVWARQLAKED